MTGTLLPPEAEHLARLSRLNAADALELACKAHLGVWAERKRGFTNAPLHWEWCELAMTTSRLAVVAPRDHAKALALDTPVLTPTGHRPLAEIAVGDMVLSRTGPVQVTAVSETFTDHDCYRVTLDDGQSFIADAGHRWITYYAWRGGRIVTTEQIAADQAARTDQRHVIDCVPADFPEADLPIDPYILGAWLGDGTASRAEITTADPEVLAAFEDAGYLESYRRPTGAAVTVGFSAGWVRAQSLWGQLRRLGVLGNKHVPEPYLWGSRKQRLALLQGLCDTDASCSATGQVVFTNTRKQLTAAVAHLVWSLGWKPKRYQTRATLNGRDCGPVWGVCWYPDEPVFRLARKAARQRLLPEGRRSKALGRSVRVERTLTVPVRCLATESGDFLIGEGVVTHNTEVFTVNDLAWRCTYTPALWGYVFCEAGDQAKELKARIDSAVRETAPWMVAGQIVGNETESVYANWSRVTVAGVGKAVRGAHPDIIVGDDVLSEANSLTAAGRRKLARWWFGTVAGMAHPGKVRTLGELEDEQGRIIVVAKSGEPTRVRMAPTRTRLVGTPFHRQDLLMSMKDNPVYYYRRYSAEFDPAGLVAGTLAVEAS